MRRRMRDPKREREERFAKCEEGRDLERAIYKYALHYLYKWSREVAVAYEFKFGHVSDCE